MHAHVQEKVTEIIDTLELVRALLRAAEADVRGPIRETVAKYYQGAGSTRTSGCGCSALPGI
jgi:hypothetical protein